MIPTGGLPCSGNNMNRRADVKEFEATIRRVILEKNTELQKLRDSRMNRETFNAALRVLKDQFDKHGIPEKKAALSAIIERIEVRSRGFKVYFRHTQLAAE